MVYLELQHLALELESIKEIPEELLVRLFLLIDKVGDLEGQ